MIRHTRPPTGSLREAAQSLQVADDNRTTSRGHVDRSLRSRHQYHHAARRQRRKGLWYVPEILPRRRQGPPQLRPDHIGPLPRRLEPHVGSEPPGLTRPHLGHRSARRQPRSDAPASAQACGSTRQCGACARQADQRLSRHVAAARRFVAMTLIRPSSGQLRHRGQCSRTGLLGDRWAWTFNGAPAGWSVVDDTESLPALDRAFDLAVTFFDTAANYGAGHSERLLGPGVRRDVATRWSSPRSSATRSTRPASRSSATATTRPTAMSPLGSRYFKASLQRLDTDYVDVYQLHVVGPGLEAGAGGPGCARGTRRRRLDPHLRVEHDRSRRRASVLDAAGLWGGPAGSQRPRRRRPDLSTSATSSTSPASIAARSVWAC